MPPAPPLWGNCAFFLNVAHLLTLKIREDVQVYCFWRLLPMVENQDTGLSCFPS